MVVLPARPAPARPPVDAHLVHGIDFPVLPLQAPPPLPDRFDGADPHHLLPLQREEERLPAPDDADPDAHRRPRPDLAHDHFPKARPRPPTGPRADDPGDA